MIVKKNDQWCPVGAACVARRVTSNTLVVTLDHINGREFYIDEQYVDFTTPLYDEITRTVM